MLCKEHPPSGLYLTRSLNAKEGKNIFWDLVGQERRCPLDRSLERCSLQIDERGEVQHNLFCWDRTNLQRLFRLRLPVSVALTFVGEHTARRAEEPYALRRFR